MPPLGVVCIFPGAHCCRGDDTGGASGNLMAFCGCNYYYTSIFFIMSSYIVHCDYISCNANTYLLVHKNLGK